MGGAPLDPGRRNCGTAAEQESRNGATREAGETEGQLSSSFRSVGGLSTLLPSHPSNNVASTTFTAS